MEPGKNIVAADSTGSIRVVAQFPPFPRTDHFSAKEDEECLKGPSKCSWPW
jgi:hypothetical protein